MKDEFFDFHAARGAHEAAKRENIHDSLEHGIR